MANLKDIAATLAILGSGALLVGCGKDKPATEVPAGDEAAGGGDAAAGGEEASCSGDKTGEEASCSGDKTGEEASCSGDKAAAGGEGSCGGK